MKLDDLKQTHIFQNIHGRTYVCMYIYTHTQITHVRPGKHIYIYIYMRIYIYIYIINTYWIYNTVAPLEKHRSFGSVNHRKLHSQYGLNFSHTFTYRLTSFTTSAVIQANFFHIKRSDTTSHHLHIPANMACRSLTCTNYVPSSSLLPHFAQPCWLCPPFQPRMRGFTVLHRRECVSTLRGAYCHTPHLKLCILAGFYVRKASSHCDTWSASLIMSMDKLTDLDPCTRGVWLCLRSTEGLRLQARLLSCMWSR